MVSLCVCARRLLVSGLLAALACGLAAGDACAVPISTQITYSTNWLNASQVPPILEPYEFIPVTNGVATLGSDLKLGTILVHLQEPYESMPTMGIPLPIQFQVTNVGGDALSSGGVSIRTENFINHYINKDGTVHGNLEQLSLMDEYEDSRWEPSREDKYHFNVGQLSLQLKPVAVTPTWDQQPDQEVVAVDIYARLEAAPVPEPSILLIFAAAAGFGWKRFRSAK